MYLLLGSGRVPKSFFLRRRPYNADIHILISFFASRYLITHPICFFFILFLSFIQKCKLSPCVLLDFSLTVKAATLIFISWRVSTISSAKQGKSGSSYNLVKN